MAPVPFANDYCLRTAVSDGACFICHKFTPVVLISSAEGTAQAKDWFHFCPHHAQDATICRCLNNSSVTPPHSLKAADSKAPPKPTKASRNSNKDSGEQPSASGLAPNSPSATDASTKEPAAASPQSTSAAPATPRRYALHRSLFYFRESLYQQKMEQRKLHEIAKAFPATPTSRP
ncbi:hypothetical protein H4R35_005629 [Dimargaris xerosporica]|nr:hypothetical protein H4R35_005629 [Dimargaris xerosporica]